MAGSKNNSLDKDGGKKSGSRKNSFKFLESPFNSVSSKMYKSSSDTISPMKNMTASPMSLSKSINQLTPRDNYDGDDFSPSSSNSPGTPIGAVFGSSAAKKKKKRPLSVLASSIAATVVNHTPKSKNKNSNNTTPNRKSSFY